jgi:hypothetical protein
MNGSLPLELHGINDPDVRRAFEQIRLRWMQMGGGGAGSDISVVGALPGTGSDGDAVYLTTDGGFYIYSSGTWNQVSAGPIGPEGPEGPEGPASTVPGPPGTPGEQWFAGSGAPSGAMGIVGDWYIDNVSGDFYEKTGASTWTVRGQLAGPPGAPGAGVEDLDPVVVSVRRSAVITPTAAAYYPIGFDVEDADADGFWDGAWKFQPTRAGWYEIDCQLYVDTLSGSPQLNLYLVKNRAGGAFPGGTSVVEAYDTTYAFAGSGENIAVLNASKTIYFNGSTDHLEVYVWFTNGRVQSTNGTHLRANSISVAGPEGPPWVPSSYTLDPWHEIGAAGEPAFVNGYTHTGANWGKVAFRKMPDGTVRLKGLMTPGTGGLACFTLPPGYRPARPVYMTAGIMNSTPNWCRIDIDSNGVVVPNSPVGWVAWDGFSFLAEDVPVTTMLAGPVGPEGPEWVPSDYTMEPWTTLPLAAGATAFTVAETPQYKRLPTGKVIFRGSVNVPAGGTIVAAGALPAGYRPTRDFVRRALMRLDGTTWCYVWVGSNGQIQGSTNATSQVVDLSGLEYDTDFVQMLAGPKGDDGPPWLPEDYTLDTWHLVGSAGEPAFQNGWINNAAVVAEQAQFRKFPDGKVKLRGTIKNGTVPSVVFTLPPDCRPPVGSNPRFSVIANNVPAMGWVDGATGSVYVQSGSNAFVDLASIEFDTNTVAQMLAGPRGPAGGFVPAIPIVTTLPATPQDEEEVDYLFQQTVMPADATWRTWRLRYHASIAAWLPVGVQEPVYAEDGTQRGQAFGVGWSEFTGAQCLAYLPLRGLYRFEFGAGMAYNNVISNNYAGLNLWNGSAYAWPSTGTTQPTSGAYAVGANHNAAYGGIHGNKKVSAVQRVGDPATLGVFGSAAGTWSANNRYIRAFPMRIDP